MIESIYATGSYSGISGAGAIDQRRAEMFRQVDTNSDNGVDQVEFSEFARQMSEMSGISVNAEEVFSEYDASGDGLLSNTEMGVFMKDNAPPPPSASSREEQRAVSGYGMNMNTEQLTSLLNSLTNGTTDGASATEEVSTLTSDYAAKLMEIINLRTSGSNGSSRISIMT